MAHKIKWMGAHKKSSTFMNNLNWKLYCKQLFLATKKNQEKLFFCILLCAHTEQDFITKIIELNFQENRTKETLVDTVVQL